MAFLQQQPFLLLTYTLHVDGNAPHTKHGGSCAVPLVVSVIWQCLCEGKKRKMWGDPHPKCFPHPYSLDV